MALRGVVIRDAASALCLYMAGHMGLTVLSSSTLANDMKKSNAMLFPVMGCHRTRCLWCRVNHFR